MATGDAQAAFRDELFRVGLLVDTGVAGLYGRAAAYDDLLDAFDSLVTRTIMEPPFTSLRFPPVMARWVFDKTEYVKSFPDLMGSVHTFRGTDRQHAELVRLVESGGDWPGALTASDVVLASAACHPLYPLCTGRLPDGGRRFEVNGYCFRCEPSIDPARMQAFHMHEHVFVGEPDAAQRHRDLGLEKGLELLAGLGLPVESVVANDPFFGRAGTMLAASQRDEALKIEVVTPITSEDAPTAIMSANCARDHFGIPFGIETSQGETAHSACVAFGVDRVVLALLRTHGLDPGDWPSVVRRKLWP